MANDASSGVGNSSAQTVGAHAPREWEGARKRSAAGGMKRSASLCGRGCRSEEADAWEILRGSRSGIIEKQLPPGTAQSTIGKQLHSAKQGTFGRATCRTSSIATRILPQCIIEKQLPPGTAQSTIGKRMFWQTMVPNGQVLRG